MANQWKTITTAATIENIKQITAFAEQKLEALECPMRPLMQILVAIDELASNIAHYAYKAGAGNMSFSISFDEETRTIVMTFEDTGIAYNPLEAEEPDVSLSAEQRKIGGLGIFLVRKTMDDISYHREGNRNILSISKKI